MSNSVDPDETAHYEPSHLDPRCLQKPIIIYGNEKVKALITTVRATFLFYFIFILLYFFPRKQDLAFHVNRLPSLSFSEKY